MLIEPRNKCIPISTVGRTKPKLIEYIEKKSWSDRLTSIYLGNSIDHYENWKTPTVIISDGAYGILGFEGDTCNHLNLPNWYEKHISSWSKYAAPYTTLWFWNSEIGWASVHPLLEKYGWRYVNANIWNKGKAHIAGNVNTQRIKRFPVVTEVCVQYVFEAKIKGLTLKEWLLSEWKRTGLPLKKANEACGVQSAAVRKYFDQGHLWYFPPPEMFAKLQNYANTLGNPLGRPYFSLDGQTISTAPQWAKMRHKFNCPHGFTNVWDRPALRGSERFKLNKNSGRAIHFNQKPLDLMSLVIEASSQEGDIIWEPFGGLFSACIAARKINRIGYGAEIDETYFHYGLQRIIEESFLHPHSLY